MEAPNKPTRKKASIFSKRWGTWPSTCMYSGASTFNHFIFLHVHPTSLPAWKSATVPNSHGCIETCRYWFREWRALACRCGVPRISIKPLCFLIQPCVGLLPLSVSQNKSNDQLNRQPTNVRFSTFLMNAEHANYIWPSSLYFYDGWTELRSLSCLL